jgi:hypothetical protein
VPAPLPRYLEYGRAKGSAPRGVHDVCYDLLASAARCAGKEANRSIPLDPVSDSHAQNPVQTTVYSMLYSGWEFWVDWD